MTRLESLRGLYDAVEEGHMPTFPVSFAALGEAAHLADEALDRKSVDAALALFASTLPGWIWNIVENSATVWPGFPNDPWPAFDEYSDKGPATALLLACLAALIAIEEGKG